MSLRTWDRVKKELHPAHLFSSKHLMSSIISGVLVGLMTTILSISFAVLVFGKAIPEALSIGIGMAIFSNVILHLGSAFASSGEGVMSHVQSLPPPIQAAMLSSVMAMLPISMSIENRTLIAVFSVLLSAICTGIILYVFGRLKFGQLVRYLPFTVISGFLASIGFALVLGGLVTMTMRNVTFTSFPYLFESDIMYRWFPGIVLALALWMATARLKKTFVFPSTLCLAVLLFYGFYALNGKYSSDLMADNLLLGPFPNGQLWQPPHVYFHQLKDIDWTILTKQFGIIATIPLACFIGGLLMLSAIEVSTNKEVDPDFELKTMGLSNFFSGIFGGGFMGYPSTTFTLMQHSLGASTRLPGIIGAIVSIIVLLYGASFLGYIPRFVVGGLLVFFGYQFIDYWGIRLVKITSFSDLSIIASIVITFLWLGFVYSVGVGIVTAASIFLFKYSSTSVIRYVSTGALTRSRVTRNAAHDDWLSENAASTVIFGLQGYIFFGTAYQLYEEIMTRVKDNNQTPVSSVILDFRYVTGIDASVVESFQKLYVLLARKDITLVFTNNSSKNQALMQQAGFMNEDSKKFAKFITLDEALEWREDFLLENSALPLYKSRELIEVLAEYFSNRYKAEVLVQYLTRMDVPPGTKLIEQNRRADDLFFIESGRISAYSEEGGQLPIRLQTMVDDTMVGEIGFYLGQLRSATVIADKQSIVYRLTMEALTKLETDYPIVAMEFHKLMVKKAAQRTTHVYNSVK